MPRSADPSIAVFDIGGVLIDWNPRYLYRKLFAEDTAAMEEFLATVCTPDWNLQQDAGRPWKEAVEELSARHPEKAELIAAYDLEWDEMVPGPIPDTADIVWDLKRRGQKVYCITNFSVDKLDRARRRFDVLNAFDGIVVSGEVRLLKPDPAIYRRLLDDLDSLANRGYTEGFLRRHVHDEYQNYERGFSLSERQQFVGELTGERRNGLAEVKVKNRFAVGDRLEQSLQSDLFDYYARAVQREAGISLDQSAINAINAQVQ